MKVQPPVGPAGRFAKDRFDIYLAAEKVTCPAGFVAAITRDRHGDGTARFAQACAACPLRAHCTTAQAGRSITVGRYEHRFSDARAEQSQPEWRHEYQSTRPKVERKLGHLMFRKHGGRRARVRGKRKVDADFNLLAAAHNLMRLGRLGVSYTPTGWATAGA